MVLGVGDRLCCPEPWGESQTIPLPQLRFLLAAPSGACLSPKSLLSPKKEASESCWCVLAGDPRGIISLSGQWELLQIFGRGGCAGEVSH